MSFSLAEDALDMWAPCHCSKSELCFLDALTEPYQSELSHAIKNTLLVLAQRRFGTLLFLLWYPVDILTVREGCISLKCFRIY